MQHHLGHCLRCYPYPGKALKHGPYLPLKWIPQAGSSPICMLEMLCLCVVPLFSKGPQPQALPTTERNFSSWVLTHIHAWNALLVCVCESNFSSWFMTHIHAWNTLLECVCERNFSSWFLTHIHAWSAVLLCVCVCVCVHERVHVTQMAYL
jgi:hypothetical protein